MSSSIAAGNPSYLTGTSMQGVQQSATPDQAVGSAAATAAAAEAGGLSDVQLQELYAQLVATTAGLATLGDEPGATAISLPVVASPGDMGALSTADLLQLIRAEVAKTTALLVNATMEAITAQQATIELKGQENTAKIQESITAQDKAEAKAKKMEALNLALKIFGGIAVGIMLLAAVPSGGATAGIAIAMALSFTTMTCMTEIKNENGETGMDLMGKSCAKTFYSHLPPEEAEAKGAALANGIMIGLQVVVALGCVYAAFPQIGTFAAQMAAKAFGTTASAAASSAAATATAAATTTSTLASTIAPIAAKAGAALQVVQGSTGIAAGVVAMDVADAQYDASMANAEVTRLQALIKMLQQILEGESAFITMLMDLQAQLDGFVAGEVADEHVSNEQTDLHGGAMA
jgi:hypothetical protein